ncbi:hypothetical protein [Streptomyces morookaense]|uniref:Uncharacterized protein n=1 Tax=Streptomyces morookaense TaxID=1970 RepID=A0A7Y7E8W3_STRMO|nr:hypothetical protein [Streptomyces morookaense]NVK79727.1 hypothetical protein [Streptomyces morookaense]GHF31916.1 hypothetical protein GCM10010359_38100 [Streptomyces morookaense]
MGWTVLYIAFGVVALWLLGEVLLQYKARLRWRLLAFAGFLGVVAGVVIPSVAVIVVGALAFAVGQTYVTLSFRRGFDKGWAVRRRSSPAKGKRGGRRRGKGERSAAPAPAPVPSSSPEPTPAAAFAAEETQAFPAAAMDDATAVLMPDAPLQAAPDADATAVYPAYGDAGQQQQPHQQQQPYGYGHEHGQEQQYAAYSDPYIGNRQQTYGSYESYETQQAPYGQQQQYAADTYAPQHYDTDTPPGGVWVPQQRDTETPPAGEQGYGGQQYRY